MADEGNKYDIGELVTLLGTFTDPENNGNYYDPDEIKCDVRTPSGTIATYTYPSSPQIRKLAVGRYACDIPVATKGQWFYRWYSEGTGQAAEETYFYVKDSKAVAP